MNTSYGTLYGIGVGPGDPELLTLKAARLLGRMRLVFAAASPGNDYSVALSIARAHLPPQAEVRRLDFPMTRDKTILETAWEANAQAVMTALAGGTDAAFLTLGDPMTYSTFGYLHRRLTRLAPDLPVEIVPGISAIQGAAARCRQVLAEGAEDLLILPGLHSDQELRQRLLQADNAVILKAYRNFPAIRRALEGLPGKATLVSELYRQGETVITDLRDAAEKPPYLSLVLYAKDRSNGAHEEDESA